MHDEREIDENLRRMDEIRELEAERQRLMSDATTPKTVAEFVNWFTAQIETHKQTKRLREAATDDLLDAVRRHCVEARRMAENRRRYDEVFGSDLPQKPQNQPRNGQLGFIYPV